jgi:hypothetical protein
MTTPATTGTVKPVTLEEVLAAVQQLAEDVRAIQRSAMAIQPKNTVGIVATGLYSRQDIARLRGVSPYVVRGWEKKYGLTRLAQPGRPRFRGSDVLALIERFERERNQKTRQTILRTREQDRAELAAMR